MTLSTEYDQDFYAWIFKNVELLRSGNLTEVDAEHIAEELESMGKRDLRQLHSRLQILIRYLLKWQHQPQNQSKSWLSSIDHQRDQIEALLLDSPSLRAIRLRPNPDLSKSGPRCRSRNWINENRVSRRMPVFTG